MNKPKPDNRKDNVERIQHNITNTIQNMHLAEEDIETTNDANYKQALTDKNNRRQEALEGMRREIKDEATARQNNYK